MWYNNLRSVNKEDWHKADYETFSLFKINVEIYMEDNDKQTRILSKPNEAGLA